MNQLLKDVVEFHTTYGQPVLTEPAIPSKERQALRISLITEELQELCAAFQNNDIVEVADALVDLMYVVNGCAAECGLQNLIDKCHTEVHASNMSKLGADGKPIKREDGKILKGPAFFSPNLKAIINGN